MLEIVEQPRTGWSVVSDGAYAVALDTTLTAELELEGAARELVRAVNEARKTAGLDLADRILLDLVVAPATLDAALETAGLYDLLTREVLATTLTRTTAVSVPESDVGGRTVVALGGLGSAGIRVERR
jgi:isoleucyl-tRNA synthetase